MRAQERNAQPAGTRAVAVDAIAGVIAVSSVAADRQCASRVHPKEDYCHAWPLRKVRSLGFQ